MRRYLIGVLALVTVTVGALAVFAGGQRSKSCGSSGGQTVAGACSTSEPAVPSKAPHGAIAGNFDPAMSGVCRFACATKLKYKEADVVPQPGAQEGMLTQCPVSGVVFAVDASRPHVKTAGTDYVTCCDGCATKLRQNPGRNRDGVSIGKRDRQFLHRAFGLYRRAADRLWEPCKTCVAWFGSASYRQRSVAEP